MKSSINEKEVRKSGTSTGTRTRELLNTPRGDSEVLIFYLFIKLIPVFILSGCTSQAKRRFRSVCENKKRKRNWMSGAGVTVWHEIRNSRDPCRLTAGSTTPQGRQDPPWSRFSVTRGVRPQNNVVSRLHLARVPGPAFLGRSSIFSPSPVRSVPALWWRNLSSLAATATRLTALLLHSSRFPLPIYTCIVLPHKSF